MFELIRSHRRWMQFILMLLIVPSFFLVGIQGYDSFMNREPELATVADQPVTRAEFDRLMRNQMDLASQQMKGGFDPALIDTPLMRQAVLDQIINERLLFKAALDNRFSASDNRLRTAIAADPKFQDEDRHFSSEKYGNWLAMVRLSPAAYQEGIKTSLAIADVVDPVVESALVPQVLRDALLADLSQIRTVRLQTFAANDFRSKVSISPEDIQAWYDANKKQFEVPEQVTLEYVLIDQDAATRGIEVSDADIRSYYEQNKAGRFTTKPERRRASHIMIQLPANATAEQRKEARAQAEELAGQAAAYPEQFAELARSQSQDKDTAAQGGDFGWWQAGQLAAALGPQFEKAVFDLSKDQVSGVVETSSSLHVIKLTDIEPATVQSLDSARQDIINAIRMQLGGARFAEMGTQLAKLADEHPESLQPAADALGLKVGRIEGMTRSGLQTQGRDVAAIPNHELIDTEPVRRLLFSSELMQDKQNSTVIQASPNALLAVRVAQADAAHIPPLEQLSDVIRANLLTQRSAEAAQKAGQDLLQALADPASAAHAGFGPAMEVSRGRPAALPASVLAEVMRIPDTKLPAYAGIKNDRDFVVVALEKISQGVPDQRILSQIEMLSVLGLQEAERQAVMVMLREQYKVKVMPEGHRMIQAQRETGTE